MTLIMFDMNYHHEQDIDDEYYNECGRYYDEEKELCACGSETIFDLEYCASCCRGIYCSHCGDNINEETSKCFGCRKTVSDNKKHRFQIPEILITNLDLDENNNNKEDNDEDSVDDRDIKRCRRVQIINDNVVIPELLVGFNNHNNTNRNNRRNPPNVKPIDIEETNSRD